MELLEVENLYKEFYKDKIKFAAVDHIHFSIREGECLGLVGESGCGKSTTASLIAGLLIADTRRICPPGRCAAYGGTDSVPPPPRS